MILPYRFLGTVLTELAEFIVGIDDFAVWVGHAHDGVLIQGIFLEFQLTQRFTEAIIGHT